MNFVNFKKPLRVHPFTSAIDELLHKGLSEISHTSATHSKPKVNILEIDDAYKIELAAPGLKKSDFNISLDKDQLIIKVNHETESNEEDSKAAEATLQKYTRREFNYASFMRSFHMPKSINKDDIKAEYLDGILNITLTKIEEAKEKEPKMIAIS